MEVEFGLIEYNENLGFCYGDIFLFILFIMKKQEGNL